MSDPTPTVRSLLKHWVLDLRLGNEISPDGWVEIRAAIAKLPDSEREAPRAMVLDLLTELDHGKN